MLHTVNKSPFEKNSLDTCLRLALPGSAILLLEDGVYAAMQGTEVADRVSDATSRCRLYVLGPDLEGRGLDANAVVPGITIVDYSGFVDLIVEHDKIQSWF
uniref:Intracellular sulfur oxidation protein DsrH n=1 Tax=uncultured bacterium ws156A7 TaxID=1131828 RepID=I1X4S3_9BACT|nr:intracellular sulfur oxidation protein DsrH [uncultured bacterium ws156A7]